MSGMNCFAHMDHRRTAKGRSSSSALIDLALITIALSAFSPIAFGQGQTGTSSGGVYGWVKDVNGNPLVGVAVTLYDASGSFLTTTQTLLGGDFSFGGLSRGSYKVQLDRKGYEDKSIAFSLPRDDSFVDLGDTVLNYGLKLSVTLTYLKVNSLSDVSIPMILQNIGSEDEPVQLLVQAPAGWTAGAYSGENEVLNMTLSPGDTEDLILEVAVPYSSAGLYALNVTAAGVTVQECEVWLYVNKTDLQILTARYPMTEATPGSTVDFDLTIKNTLTKRFTGVMSVVLPSGWTGSIVGDDGSSLYGISLDPNELVSAKVEADIPATEGSGDHEITVRLEAGDLESTLQLGVVVITGAALPKLSTETPYVDAYAGQTAVYSIGVGNTGTSDGILNLNVTGLPAGYSCTIKDSAGNVLSKLYLKPGDSKTLSVTISVPPLTEPDIKSFTLQASIGETVSRLNLGLGILGYYSISYVTQDFYLESTAGASGTFQVVVKNTGYSSLSNMKLTVSDVPSQFSVAVEPSVVLTLGPQESAAFTLTVTTNADVNAGDYYITLGVAGDQSQISARSLHVYVRQSSELAYIGAGIAVVLAIALYVIYRKYGRR
ncbi:MAG TPA: NEW3 domain-containing protein [Thermoproteota archaeon]|nr:NEW3 domain-containing protein [Thermoproteota archaeon]